MIAPTRTKKKVSYLNSKRSNEELLSHRSIMQELEDNPEKIAIHNPLITKYSNKSVAFKTINLLYRAIIDSSLQRKKKEDFEVTANKLPIIDRFNITRRMGKFKDQLD